MKLSKSKLNQIIMEEYVTVKREAFHDSPEDKEKDDLLGLYSDVWKYKHGTRPRGKMQWMFDNMTADEIGQEIDDLYQSIRDKESAEAEYEAEAARRAEEEAELGRMMPDPDDLEGFPKQEPIRRPVRESKMKLTKSKLKQIIREELTSVVEEYDPVLGFDVDPEPSAEPIQVTDREKVMLKKRFKEYVRDHKEIRTMVASGMIDKWADEAQPLNAQQFINAYLFAAPGATSQKLADLAQRGLDEEGLAFFNKLGIPLKR